MNKFILLFLTFFLLIGNHKIIAQPPQYKMQIYIAAYSEEAISQMISFKIPASVIMAQAIFESRCGGSELAKKSNNHFGIKCHLEWFGDTIVKYDDSLNECFRKYHNVEQSYTDHSLFLKSRPRYASLFNLALTDYESWCYGLKEAGYATYETYAEELVRLIEQTKLYELDRVQTLPIKINLKDNYCELKVSSFNNNQIDLKRFSENSLLWLDLDAIHLRSLELMLKRSSTSIPQPVRK